MKNQEENKKEQPLTKLKTSLQTNSGLNPQVIESNLERISEVFPMLSAGFYKNLCERIAVHHFTDSELNEAVNHVLDHFTGFKEPRIGDFISFIIDNDRQPPPVPELTPEEKAAKVKRDEEEYDVFKAKREKELEEMFAREEAREAQAVAWQKERDRQPDWFKDEE